jgi:hypothetical protein
MQDERSAAPLVSAGILSLLGAITLSIESCLTTQGPGLCTTATCEVVGHISVLANLSLLLLAQVFSGSSSFFSFLHTAIRNYSAQFLYSFYTPPLPLAAP